MHVRYRIDCTPGWKTREVELDVWRGDHAERFTLEAASDQRWRRDGVELAGFQGLVDTDLGFTPATNTLAIRRLDLAVGESGTTTTVWVDFPALVVRRFPQRYTRTGEEEYLFESLEDSFKARLRVDELGLVMDYEGLWIKAARTG
jgi:hypothetical protein